jgi:hypothetical protein
MPTLGLQMANDRYHHRCFARAANDDIANDDDGYGNSVPLEQSAEIKTLAKAHRHQHDQ